MRSRLMILGLLICGILLLAAQVSVAAVMTGTPFTLDDSQDDVFYGGATGGYGSRPFEVSDWTEDTGVTDLDPIYTFCVQENEYFDPSREGAVIQVASYGTQTQATPPKNYITGYTAWVYDQFLTMIGAMGGTFGSVDALNSHGIGGDPYSSGTSQLQLSDMGKIQNAIWAGMVGDFVQNEDTNYWKIGNYASVTAADSILLSNGTNIGTDAYEDAVEDPDGDIANFYDIGRARVAVMVDTSNNNKQDQILLVEAPQQNTPPVPEPTTLAIWSLLGGVGLGLAHVRRRRA